MKMRITLIVFVLGVLPAYAERYSSGGEAFFVGILQGIFLMIVFLIWRFIRGSKSKTDEPQKKENSSLNKYVSSKPLLTPWEKYKSNNPEISKDIETISNIDMRLLSEKSIFEKESSLKRMATQYNCSISELKGVVLSTFITRFSSEELLDVIVKLTDKSKIENQKYGISEENTMSYYIQLWLTEYLKENKLC